jgi:prepilin-type N-terminal cleavage/methylation domain-containing protein
MNHQRSKKAFTLVEILVVIVILGIMGAMVTTAVSGVTTTAKQSRTRTIISIVDSVLAEQYQGLKYRQFPVETPSMWNQLDNQSGQNASVVGYEVLAKEAARVRLMMVRDLQRMELPDRYTDFISPQGPTPLVAAATFVKIESDEIVDKRDDKSERSPFPVSWYFNALPSKLEAYRNRRTPGLTTEHQGAECLFLIMANAYVGGTPALDLLPPGSTGDTDEDGMLEILDGWGKPLRYIRWPIGYFDPEFSIETAKTPDDFDVFRTDYAYEFATPSDSWAWDPNPIDDLATPNIDESIINRRRPWSTRPLVYSCGPDGGSGIRTNPGDNLIPGDNPLFSYQKKWTWEAANCGPEGASRPNSFNFPDPYLRDAILNEGSLKSRLPGSVIPTRYAETVDDITNYQLQVGR